MFCQIFSISNLMEAEYEFLMFGGCVWLMRLLRGEGGGGVVGFKYNGAPEMHGSTALKISTTP